MILYLGVPGCVVIVNKGEHPRAWQEQRDLDIPPHDCSSSYLFRVTRFRSARSMPDDASSSRKPQTSSFFLSRNRTRTPATESAVRYHGTPLIHTYRQPKPYCRDAERHRGCPNTATITLNGRLLDHRHLLAMYWTRLRPCKRRQISEKLIIV